MMEPRIANPNLLYFASCQRNRVEEFLKNSAYDWLSDAGKEYVLNHLDNTLQNGFRVMDPALHPSPQLMTRNMEHYQAVLRL